MKKKSRLSRFAFCILENGTKGKKISGFKSSAQRLRFLSLCFYRLDQKMSPRHHSEHHKPQSTSCQLSHTKFHHRATNQSAVVLKIVALQERAFKID